VRVLRRGRGADVWSRRCVTPSPSPCSSSSRARARPRPPAAPPAPRWRASAPGSGPALRSARRTGRATERARAGSTPAATRRSHQVPTRRRETWSRRTWCSVSPARQSSAPAAAARWGCVRARRRRGGAGAGAARRSTRGPRRMSWMPRWRTWGRTAGRSIRRAAWSARRVRTAPSACQRSVGTGKTRRAASARTDAPGFRCRRRASRSQMRVLDRPAQFE
jgi:hypothetical protein